MQFAPYEYYHADDLSGIRIRYDVWKWRKCTDIEKIRRRKNNNGISAQFHHSLHVVRPKWRARTIIDSCINGSSEMVSVLAFSVIAILFNRILMSLGGSDGVASLSIIWYAQGLFGGLFRGYVNGISSVVSYNFGRQDKAQLSSLFRISIGTLEWARCLVF